MFNDWKVKGDKLIFRCGCSFDIIQHRENHLPLVEPRDPYTDWNLTCDATKMLLERGKSLGVFQLDSSMGQHWVKELKPESVEDMSAMGAIIRPGVLEVKDEEGISATKKYCMYKNGEREAVPDVPILKDILSDTYYQMIYQEDIMRIAIEVAGFTGPQANTLMKGVGKKLQDVIANLRKEFIDGCLKVGKVNEREAITIFENIAKSGRYLFNKSHSVAYGKLGLVTAYAKAHFTEYFFAANLEGAENKQDTLDKRYDLIVDAKSADIQVLRPSLKESQREFYSPKKNKILFGLNSIKCVGDKIINKIINSYTESDKWLDVLVGCLYNIDIRAAENIIKAGIIPSSTMTRKQQLHELKILCELTASQAKFALENYSKYNTLAELLEAINKPKKEGGALHSPKAKAKIDSLIYTLKNPGFSLEDNPEWICAQEEEILGIALSASILDGVCATGANTTCREINYGKRAKGMTIACQVDKILEKVIKSGNNKGKNYIKIDVSDKTDTISGLMVWPEIYSQHSDIIKEKNTILIKFYVNRKEELGIEKVFQI